MKGNPRPTRQPSINRFDQHVPGQLHTENPNQKFFENYKKKKKKKKNPR